MQLIEVTDKRSVTVLKVKSNISALKTKGMKKLNNVKSNPKNKQNILRRDKFCQRAQFTDNRF